IPVNRSARDQRPGTERDLCDPRRPAPCAAPAAGNHGVDTDGGPASGGHAEAGADQPRRVATPARLGSLGGRAHSAPTTSANTAAIAAVAGMVSTQATR